MNIFNNFLRKLFGVVAALFYYVGCDCAFADHAQVSYLLMDEYYNKQTTLCSGGYYVSSCNQITIGTNWLKGIKGTTETPDYYSYDLPDSDTTNITNLRKFFGGVEPISYKTADGTETTANSEDYKSHRNTILNTFCTDGNGKQKGIVCKKCPNDATVSESTVNIGNYSGKIMEGSWKVHTIADCYVEEFSDHTGTFVYVPNNSAKNSASAKKCYYSNDVEGDELISE
jgi:hypothetical protein